MKTMNSTIQTGKIVSAEEAKKRREFWNSLCPDCGCRLVPASGCAYCPCCGWSICS